MYVVRKNKFKHLIWRETLILFLALVFRSLFVYIVFSWPMLIFDQLPAYCRKLLPVFKDDIEDETDELAAIVVQ